MCGKCPCMRQQDDFDAIEHHKSHNIPTASTPITSTYMLIMCIFLCKELEQYLGSTVLCFAEEPLWTTYLYFYLPGHLKAQMKAQDHGFRD